ncbi:hypothetical protein KFL_011180040 [Klebsormidium nitens]|uniref:Retrotransposon gag domain-containing protein n=1 Tax=Klebsormidium nitens TaxID=105231 RepID=A0A1Y1IVM5_KLENI|nr:hypothetical protein KFL_011180040 [Klebsormidium nitens]|eukprot:GAQ92747.1 hypothetical protein KFL_011180040 [Klebsormidium nitens]
MIRGYGLRTPIQSYWDTWNKLSKGSKSVDDYNIDFNQAMVNLREEITDEAVKIERYRSGLQPDLREMCRTNTPVPKGGLVRQLQTDHTWAVVRSPEKLRVLFLASVSNKVSSEAGLLTNKILAGLLAEGLG